MNELQITSQENLIKLANDFIVKNAIIPSKSFNVTNAMVALYTNVLTVKDKNGKMALETCTPASIQNAVYECITKELTPSKKQAYFIPYGNELQLQTSYFGNQKIARDVAGVVINSMVVHEGDQIDVEVRVNGTMIIKHKPNITCLNKPIIMAYAVACNEVTGEVINSDIMTIEEIRKSWAKSRSKDMTVSKEFPHEMARRTVTNRLAKHIINTSDDSRDVYITDIDGRRIKVNKYEDLPQETFDYTIDTDANETYTPETATENVVTAKDLKLDNEPAQEQVEIPEGAFEMSYKEYKANVDKYEMVKGSWNAETRTVMVTNK